jgi:hypothetical protein
MEELPTPRPAAYGLRRHIARLFGVRLVSDIHEKLAEEGRPLPLDAKRRRRLAAIREAGSLFIHIPKNAGMSISQALYREQIKHVSIRYYARVAPELAAGTPSFALLRDPVERFLSAYGYGKAGGGADNQVSLPFRATYMGFGSVDAALDHLESARSPYHLDHIFRPQSWYVTGGDGRVAVDRLLLVEEIDKLAEFVPGLRGAPLPHLNKGRTLREALNPWQVRRLHRLYEQDFELVEALRAETARKARRYG